MTGARIELANPHRFESTSEYIEKHLAPAVTELHRIANELMAPGSTSTEEHLTDMGPSSPSAVRFSRLDRPLRPEAKHVVFDGTSYFALPPDLLRSKQVKVLFTATVGVVKSAFTDSEAYFRLVCDNGEVITNSDLRVSCTDSLPVTLSATLPFGDHPGSVSPDARAYYIEGRATKGDTPYCRRFSMSFMFV